MNTIVKRRTYIPSIKKNNSIIRKRSRNFPMYKSPKNMVFKFSRTISPLIFNLATSTDSLDGFSYELNNVPGYTEFTSLFQFYRIRGVAVTFKCYQTETTIGSASVTTRDESAPNVACLLGISRNDANAPANWGEVCQLESTKLWFLLSGTRIYFKPTTLNNADQMFNWISTSSPSVPHYGLKMVIPATTTDAGSTIKLSYVVTYYLEFKDPK